MDNATRRAVTEWAILRALSPNLGDTPLTPYILALVCEDLARQEQPVLHMQATFPAATTEVKPVYGPDSGYVLAQAVVAAYRKPEEPAYNRFLVVPADEATDDDNLPIEVVGGPDTDEALAQLAEIEAQAKALLDSMVRKQAAQNGHKAPTLKGMIAQELARGLDASGCLPSYVVDDLAARFHVSPACVRKLAEKAEAAA